MQIIYQIRCFLFTGFFCCCWIWEEPGGIQSKRLQRVEHDWVAEHTKKTWLMKSLQNIRILDPNVLEGKCLKSEARVPVQPALLMADRPPGVPVCTLGSSLPLFPAPTPDLLKEPAWCPPSYSEQISSSPLLQKIRGSLAGSPQIPLLSPESSATYLSQHLASPLPSSSQEETSYLSSRAPSTWNPASPIPICYDCFCILFFYFLYSYFPILLDLFYFLFPTNKENYLFSFR